LAGELTHDLMVRNHQALSRILHRHEIGEHDSSTGGTEGCLKYVRLLHVFAIYGTGSRWSDLPITATFSIKQSCEDGWRVEARPAQPIYTARFRNQGGAAAIADYAVVPDIGIGAGREVFRLGNSYIDRGCHS